MDEKYEINLKFYSEKIKMLEEQIRLQKEIIELLKRPKEIQYVPYYPPVSIPSVWQEITCKEPVITTSTTYNYPDNEPGYVQINMEDLPRN